MGKTYTTKSPLSIQEMAEIFKNIYGSSIKGERFEYYYSFNLGNIQDYGAIVKRFPVVQFDVRPFLTNIPETILLTETASLEGLYNRLTIHPHFPNMAKDRYTLTYDIFLDVNRGEIKLTIYLKPENNESEALNEINFVINSMVKDKVLNMNEESIQYIFSNIRTLNTRRQGNFSWSELGLTVTSFSNIVRLMFNVKHFKRYNRNIFETFQLILTTLMHIIQSTDYYVLTVYSQHADRLIKKFESKDSIKYSTPILIDLDKMHNFDINELIKLNDPGERKELGINGFTFLESHHHNYLDYMRLYISESSFEFSLYIHMDADELIIPIIEKNIGHELKFIEYS